MKKILIVFMVFVLTMGLAACQNTSQSSGSESEPVAIDSTHTEGTEDVTAMKMSVTIGNQSFTATLEDNAATRELIEIMRTKPISIDMDDYSGFEKVGSLGRSLTTDNRQITTQAGDIVLYSGNQIEKRFPIFEFLFGGDIIEI